LRQVIFNANSVPIVAASQKVKEVYAGFEKTAMGNITVWFMEIPVQFI
jgi:hypothetical protein